MCYDSHKMTLFTSFVSSVSELELFQRRKLISIWYTRTTLSWHGNCRIRTCWTEPLFQLFYPSMVTSSKWKKNSQWQNNMNVIKVWICFCIFNHMNISFLKSFSGWLHHCMLWKTCVFCWKLRRYNSEISAAIKLIFFFFLGCCNSASPLYILLNN